MQYLGDNTHVPGSLDSLSIEDEIVAALRQIVRGIDLHSRKLVHAVGLTWPQLATLRAVHRFGPCSIRTLARSLHLGQATLTGIVQRLERLGYLSRIQDESDRRSVRISITPSGVDVLKDAPSLLQDRFLSELAKLKDWERHMTLASFQRIAEMMDVESLDASPILMAGPVDSPQAAIDANPSISASPIANRIKRVVRTKTDVCKNGVSPL